MAGVEAEFQSQTSPLDPSDLVQAYLLLRAAHKAGKHIFAFYNCVCTVFPSSVLESGLKQLSSPRLVCLGRRWPERRESATQASAVPPHSERRWPAHRAASKSRPHRERRSVTPPLSNQQRQRTD